MGVGWGEVGWGVESSKMEKRRSESICVVAAREGVRQMCRGAKGEREARPQQLDKIQRGPQQEKENHERAPVIDLRP